jgi:hypothetical protein
MSNDFKIDVVDIEREIEKKIITILRFLFNADKDFRYSDDDKETRLCIGTDYPNNETPMEIPHLIISGITYSFDMGNSIFQNYANPVFNDDGVNVGHRYLNTIPFSYQVNCYGENYESRNLANRALNYITFVGKSAFNALNVKTLRAEKGNTTPSSQFPKKFHTALIVSGVYEWSGAIRALDESKLNLLKSITLNNTD